MSGTSKCAVLAWLTAAAGCSLFSAAPKLALSLRVDLSHLFNPQITADGQGNIIVVGYSPDCAREVVHPISTCGPIWIAKLDPTGTKIVFATYIGAPGPTGLDFGVGLVGVRTDPDGNIVVASNVRQAVLPVVNAFQPTLNGNASIHIFKLAADGSRLIFATYLGGSGYDSAMVLSLDGTGAIYISGQTNGQGFPTTPQSFHSAAPRSFVTKLSPDGQRLIYAALLDLIRGLELDGSGSVTTVSETFTYNNEILKLSPDGSSVRRMPIPPWAPYYNLWVLPTSDGGYWLAGSVSNGLVPVTDNAVQSVHGLAPYRRIEQGVAYEPARPMVGHVLNSFAVDPIEPWRIYCATSAGVFRSEDNGWTWDPLFSLPAVSVLVDPFDQNILYVASATSSVDYSPDSESRSVVSLHRQGSDLGFAGQRRYRRYLAGGRSQHAWAALRGQQHSICRDST